MKRNGLLVVVSGPSGTGKGTICQALLADQRDIFYSISATTRKPRAGEVHGVNYFFVSPDEFQTMLDNRALLEYAQVYDHCYGTPRTVVEQQMDEGKTVLLEIDIQGALQVKRAMPEAVLVYILPPSFEVLCQRIYGRGTDSREAIEKRLHCLDEELQSVDHYQYVVINDDLQDAVNKLKSIITAERCMTPRNQKMIAKLQSCTRVRRGELNESSAFGCFSKKSG